MLTDAKITEFLERLEELTRSTGIAINQWCAGDHLVEYDPDTFRGYAMDRDGDFTTWPGSSDRYQSPAAKVAGQ